MFNSLTEQDINSSSFSSGIYVEPANNPIYPICNTPEPEELKAENVYNINELALYIKQEINKINNKIDKLESNENTNKEELSKILQESTSKIRSDILFM